MLLQSGLEQHKRRTTDLHPEGRLTLEVEVQGVAEASIGIVGMGTPGLGLLLCHRNCVLSDVKRESGIFEVEHRCTACIPDCLRCRGQ